MLGQYENYMEAVVSDSDFKHTPLNKLFWKYTIPTIAAMVVNGMYTTVDGIFIGRYIGANGLAAFNILWTVYGFVIGIGLMIGSAASALFSIEKGKNNPETARQYLANGIFLLIIASVFSSLMIHYFGYAVISFQLPDAPVVLDLAMDYFFILILFSFCPLFSCAFPMLIRNDEKPKLATRLMITGALINIVLDYIFIYHFHWGMKGAAIATVAAQGIVMLFGFAYFFSKRANLQLHLSDFKISLRMCGKILFLGISSLMMALYYCAIAIAYNKFFGKYGTTLTVAAYAIVGYISYFYYLFAEGMTSGIQPIISYNFGAARFYNIRRVLKKTSKILFGLYVFFLALIFLFPNQIASLFSGDDIALLNETSYGLRLFLLTCFLEAFILLGAVYFQAIDKGKKAAIITILNLVVQMPFMFVLAHYYGVTGIWLVYPTANIPLSIFVYLMLRDDLKKVPKWYREEKKAARLAVGQTCETVG